MKSTSACTPASGMALYSEARMPPTALCPFNASSPAALASATKRASSSASARKNGTFIRERTAAATSLR